MSVNRVGLLIWISAFLALLSYASSYIYPRKTFRLFVWGFENIPLMHWLFPLLPMGPTILPLALLLFPAMRKGGDVPKHAIYPLVFLLACLVAYLGFCLRVWFFEDPD